MALVAGTTLSFDSDALKESLDSVIWDLFPMDTFFISNVDKVNVTNTQHQWAFDALAAAGANKQLEGDDASYTTLVTVQRVSNYTQISNKTVLLSDTHTEGLDVIGTNPMGRAVMKSMKELKRDMEYTCLGKQGSSAGATGTARATGGVEAWIWGQGAAVAGNTVVPTTGATNGNTAGTTPSYASSAVAGVTDGTTGITMALADVTSALQLAWTDGGEPTILLASAAQKNYIDVMTSLATRTVDIDRTSALPISNTANIIVTSYGTVKVVLSRYLARSTALVLDMDKWALGQLRPVKVKDMAKTGDSSKKLMVGEYTVIARNPNSSAKLSSFHE